MPAYQGWTDDYSKLVNFLDDILYYDIAKSDSLFKFENSCPFSDRNKYLDNICGVLSHLIQEIEETQKNVEKELCKRK